MAEIYLSVKNVAKRYNTHEATPWRWAADTENDFPLPVQLSAGCTRWKLSDLEAWEQNRATVTA